MNQVGLLLLTISLATLSIRQAQANNYVFSYYYGMDNGLKPWEQPSSKITHVLFSFANVVKDGTVSLYGPPNSAAGTDAINKATTKVYKNWDNEQCNCQGQCLKGELWQMFLFKKKYPHIKTIMSIGGWTWSDNFSDVFANANSRRRAIETSAVLMDQFGFDGLDIDWEFPATQKDTAEFPFWTTRDQDWDNMALFFAEARKAWGQKYMLTYAATAFVYPNAANGLRSMAQSLDVFLVMSYEFQHGRSITWGTGTLRALPSDPQDLQTHNVVAGIQTYVALGIPKSKLVMGIPLYASGFSGLPPSGPFLNNIGGLGVPTTGSVKIEQPVAYNVLLTTVVNKSNWKKSTDTQRGVTSYFDSASGAVWFVDSPDSVKAKAQYVKDQQFAGIMVWNSNQDMPEDDPNSLMTAISTVLAVDTAPLRKTSFCLPASSTTPWCNLKCGYSFPEGNFDEKPLFLNSASVESTNPPTAGTPGTSSSPGTSGAPATSGSSGTTTTSSSTSASSSKASGAEGRIALSISALFGAFLVSLLFMFGS